MTRLSALLCVLVLCLFAPVHLEAQSDTAPSSAPDSILFVGNSFTFYNNAIYSHLRKLLMAEDPATRQSILLKSMTISGAVLADHDGGLKQMLDLRPWHTIVLQGHSLEAVDPERTDGFTQTLAEFSSLIENRGARPVLFMTWAYAGRPEMIEQLAPAFSRLGEQMDMKVIPVGLAFVQALNDIPGLELHVADKIHPSLAGTYLAAAVFYAALYGKSPEHLEYDAGLDAATARQLRQIAWNSTRDYYSRP